MVVTCVPVSTIADMFRMCLGFLWLRWNLDVLVVEVRTVLTLDVALRLLGNTGIGDLGASESRGSDHLVQECRCEIPHPRYHVRI